jgi:hypothetical protein
MRRAEKIFEDPMYVHLHRHPFPSVASLGQWAINRDWVNRCVPNFASLMQTQIPFIQLQLISEQRA